MPKKFRVKPRKDIDRGGNTNGERAERALAAIIDAYQIGGDAGATIENLEECNAADLISDIFHLADREGWDIANLVADARRCHAQER